MIKGSLAIVCALSHLVNQKKCELFDTTFGYSQTYGIAGFFMLSAFLLTYRLLEDFHKATNPRQCLLFILKYFIRRFCRIYVTYIIASIGYKFIYNIINKGKDTLFQSSLVEILTIGNAGQNHLWTIPPEIKYYFLIPLFCLIACFLNLKSPFGAVVLLGVSISFTLLDQMFNLFNLNGKQLYDHGQVHQLKLHFAVFLMGSEVALGFHLIEKCDHLMKFVKSKLIQLIFNIASLLIAFKCLKDNFLLYAWDGDFGYRSRPTVYWSIVLFLTLLSRPTVISEFFVSSQFLKSVGKFSFSFYLLHVLVAEIVRTFYMKTELELVLKCIVATYVASYFSFYLVENRLIKLANYLCSRVETWQFFHQNNTIDYLSFNFSGKNDSINAESQ